MKDGNTVMVAITGVVPGFSAVKGLMVPVPDVPRPMEVLSFVHAYVVVPPVEFVVKESAVVCALLHTTTLAGWFTWAEGFTVNVNDFTGPWHVTPPFVKNGVTTTVAMTGADPAFTAVNAPMFPVPLAARPMPGVSFVHG